MPGTQRGKRNPSTRGDFTGNKKEVLQREHEEAVGARRDEIGMISAGKQAIKDEGVIDLMDGNATLEVPEGASAAAQQLSGVPLDIKADEPVPAPAPPSEEGTVITGSSATIEVVEMPEERPIIGHGSGEVVRPEEQNLPTMVRALYDLEDITLGYGNNVTLREGYRYKIPRWSAAHLSEKGLVSILELNPA